MFKMVSCFSSPFVFATPPIYVLSKIPNLAECLKAVAMPGIQIKPVVLPDNFEEEAALTEEQSNAVKEAEIVICDTPLLVKTYKNMPNLKWAHCTWAGLDPLFNAVAEEPSFTITRHSSEDFCNVMAEYVVCQILNCERLFKFCWKNQQSKTWSQTEAFSKFRTLDEITVSILGAGNMAAAIAGFLKSRGTIVWGFARNPRTYTGLFDKISTNLDDILPECDYICNTLPSTPLTKGMLNNSVLQKCIKKPVFINVGRGSVIFEKELIHALRSGWLSQAVLDVFEKEPLPDSSELWDMDQVTITPHIAAISKPEHIAAAFFENLIGYIEGHCLKNVVNWSAGY